MRSIYLDHSTTTPMAASVRESMLPFLGEIFGHPSSSHWLGRASEEAVEDARANLASLLGSHPSEIIFTSGGTESVNLGILGVARAINKANAGKSHFITSTIEHAAVRETAKQLEREGWEISYVPCDDDGVIDLAHLEQSIRPETRLMSVMHASHQTGVVQPIDEISVLCHEHDILLHTDAAQTVGKIESNIDQLGVDLLSLSGHKFHGPVGSGALFVRMGVPIQPLLFGDGGEGCLRPGSHNIPHIVGLGQAAKLAYAGLESSIDKVAKQRDRLHRQLEKLIGRAIRVHGLEVKRVPGILSLELPGVTAEAMQNRLPEICFGPTTPCAGRQRSVANQELSPLGISHQQMANTLRISIGWSTAEDDLLRAAQMIATAYDSLIES